MIMGHAFNTWAVAHVFHPFMCTLILWCRGWGFDLNSIHLIAGFSILSLVLSIPSLLLYYVFSREVLRLTLSPETKFSILVLVTPVITVGSVLALLILMTGPVFTLEKIPEMLSLSLPSIIATVASVAIRYPQFLKLDQSCA
jgi:hypothetical protein